MYTTGDRGGGRCIYAQSQELLLRSGGREALLVPRAESALRSGAAKAPERWLDKTTAAQVARLTQKRSAVWRSGLWLRAGEAHR